jgi:cation transport ATPase
MTEHEHDHGTMVSPEAGHSDGVRDHADMMRDPAVAAMMESDMRRRFWVALAFTGPLAIMAGDVPGLPVLIHSPAASWIGLTLATPVVFWSDWMFIAGAASALRHGKLDMSVLIAVGVLAAYLSSVYLTIVDSGCFQSREGCSAE